jgi:mono/diheme cytochrome c family protein
MNLRNRSAWVRVAGLAAVLGLVACDGGSDKTEKKADPAAEKAAADKAAADKVAADAKAAADKVAADAKAAADKAAAEAKAAADKVAADAKAAEERLAGFDGKALYEAKCKSCHAIDGKGSKAMQKNKIPDMSNPDWQAKHDRAKVIAAITDGVKDTKMQAFKEKLKPEEIEAIAVYVATLKP